MIIKGKKQTTEFLDVSIDPVEVVQKLWIDSLPKGCQYVKYGLIYAHDFSDYHKGVDYEKVERKATQSEIDLNDAFLKIMKHLREDKDE